MGNLLSSLPKTIHASLGLAIILFLGLFFNNGGFEFDRIFWSWLMRFVHEAMTLGIGSGGGKYTAIGIGMWLGLYMAFNVWFIIWPNQKKALGIVDCEPDVKAKSARTAMLFSRTNTLLSLPMLLSMVAAQNLY